MKTFKEFIQILQELQESSSGEKTRGRATLARGRGRDMSKRERTVAAISKKAGIRGTGKYSKKDLKKNYDTYSTYDSDNMLDDIGSTEQDHFIHKYPSARSAADGESLIKKLTPSRKVGGWTKFKSAPSKDSVRRVKDLRKNMVKSGANKRGSVHSVSIMHRDSDVAKGDPSKRIERGKNFIKALKDTPKHLKAAGVKSRDAVIGKPSAVMQDEDNDVGVKKRANLYKKVFGKKSTKRSNKTGYMVGAAD
jgi:hypothetical protein